MEIRGFMIKYCKIKMKEREREELLLHKKANKLGKGLGKKPE